MANASISKSLEKKRGGIKKRGFTLIELVAIIAIIGILAIVVVPNVSGYTLKAKRSRIMTNAKQLINAIDVHNIESEISGTLVADSDKISSIKSIIVGDSKKIKSLPEEFSYADLTVGQVRKIVEGTAQWVELKDALNGTEWSILADNKVVVGPYTKEVKTD